MSEDRPVTDAERRLERESAELEHRLQKLDEHLDKAQQKAQERRRDLEGEQLTGDMSDQGPGPGRGQDPEGAFRDDA